MTATATATRAPWGFGRHGEDLAGWDVLVVQEELESGDPLKLWGSPVLHPAGCGCQKVGRML